MAEDCGDETSTSSSSFPGNTMSLWLLALVVFSVIHPDALVDGWAWQPGRLPPSSISQGAKKADSWLSRHQKLHLERQPCASNNDNKNCQLSGSDHSLHERPINGLLTCCVGIFFTLASPAMCWASSPLLAPSSSSATVKEHSVLRTPTTTAPRSHTFHSESSLLVSSTSVDTTATLSAEAKSSVALIDEVWELIHKYYINQPFLIQNDWDTVRDTYRTKALQPNNNPEAIAAEMTALLQDKYSRFLSSSQYAAIQKYDLIGVGVTLMPDSSAHMIVGAPPVPGSEAARVGMAKGDWVKAINGISTVDKTAFDIIDQIGEDPNAPTITMRVQKNNEEKDLVLKRAFAKVNDPIQYRVETRKDGTRVAFIKITEFNALVKGSLEHALAQVHDADAYVIDMRHNTGGAFQSAVEISGLFLTNPNAVATYVVDGTGTTLPFKPPPGTHSMVDATAPIVVWVDGRTASASEVLAGALHDNCRAVVMGASPSFGKGWIQAVYGLNEKGAGLVLTVARYVTPNGSDIQGVGIQPDVVGPLGPFGILGTEDTSTVDFDDIRQRMKMCRIPEPMATGPGSS